MATCNLASSSNSSSGYMRGITRLRTLQIIGRLHSGGEVQHNAQLSGPAKTGCHPPGGPELQFDLFLPYSRLCAHCPTDASRGLLFSAR